MRASDQSAPTSLVSEGVGGTRAYYNEVDPTLKAGPKRIWSLYVITHVATGRQYVGATCRINRRWREHLRFADSGATTALASAVRQYGSDAFTFDVVACAASREDACDAERLLIIQFGTKAPAGFNLTDGGIGSRGLPDDIIERIAAKCRGRKVDPAVLAKRSASQKGIKRSAAFKAAVSAARKGQRLSAEHRAKLSAAKIGKKRAPRTKEHSAKISEGLRAAWARRRRVGAGQ